MSYAFINQSVGKNGKNVYEDVMSIQIRLNRWIMEGKLPNVAMLAVDGGCGAQTKKTIGAFQKLYLGMNNPDCRVDPGGVTLDKLFQSLISPVVSKADFDAWLKSQASAAQPASDGWMNDIEGWQIKKHWGQQILDWASIPPEGVEAKEFSPPGNMTQAYKTVFVWKSQTPNITCVASPKARLQVLALLRDDIAYWQQRMPSYQQAIQVQTAAAAAVNDYRDFIICKKYCPPAAFNRLAAQGKDLIYLMFLGMFQLLSPVGLAGAPAASSMIADVTKVVIEGVQTGKWPWTPYKDPSGDPFWSRYKNKCT